ncbi:hypothetical protein [Streptomyces sp. DASNCL29]|uniref:hypothetical protein n=1 Tax=Streptomyces sp. DASNCL29 TaxID=2583819 RepID=UPI0019D17303|nr:hypothetical protein [Streptomyces sp. DASNCL29]
MHGEVLIGDGAGAVQNQRYLTLVLNGVYVTATVLGPQGPAQRTGELARRLIWTACDESGRA